MIQYFPLFLLAGIVALFSMLFIGRAIGFRVSQRRSLFAILWLVIIAVCNAPHAIAIFARLHQSHDGPLPWTDFILTMSGIAVPLYLMLGIYIGRGFNKNVETYRNMLVAWRDQLLSDEQQRRHPLVLVEDLTRIGDLCYYQLDLHHDAATAYDRAYGLLKEHFGAEHPSLAKFYGVYAQILDKVKRKDDAKRIRALHTALPNALLALSVVPHR